MNETYACGKRTKHEPHNFLIVDEPYWCPGIQDEIINVTDTGGGQWVRPDHYGGEENPFEPIKIIEYHDLNFNLGSVIKYVLRSPFKGTPLADLKKAYTFLGFEIRRRERLGETE